MAPTVHALFSLASPSLTYGATMGIPIVFRYRSDPLSSGDSGDRFHRRRVIFRIEVRQARKCAVSSRSEEYRRNAMVCERLSHTTSNEAIRASWLRLAESWLRMIPQESLSEPHSFDLASQLKETGQADSKTPH